MKFSGLGLQNLYEIANSELLNSKELTRELYEKVKTRKNSNYKIKVEELRNSMNEKLKCCGNISNETGSSNWLTIIIMCKFNTY